MGPFPEFAWEFPWNFRKLSTEFPHSFLTQYKTKIWLLGDSVLEGKSWVNPQHHCFSTEHHEEEKGCRQDQKLRRCKFDLVLWEGSHEPSQQCTSAADSSFEMAWARAFAPASPMLSFSLRSNDSNEQSFGNNFLPFADSGMLLGWTSQWCRHLPETPSMRGGVIIFLL